MVTRKEVAERANVSLSVVSRVMNGKGYVAEDKRQAVLKAAQELNYNPDPLAISMRTKRTKQLLFYYPDILNCYNLELYNGILFGAQQYGYMAIASGALDFSQINTLMIDGVILPSEYFSRPEFIGQLKVPAVTAGSGGKRYAQIPNIEVDTGEAMRMLLTYLKQMHHERIAFITPYVWDDNTPRHQVYIDSMKPVFGEEISNYVVTAMQEGYNKTGGENYFLDGAVCAELFLQRNLDVTAAICFNDDIAIGFMNRFRQLGKNVPEDLSIAAIDGHSISRYTFPDLTTIKIPAFDQGTECVRALLEILMEEPLPGKKVLKPELLPGTTVKKRIG